MDKSASASRVRVCEATREETIERLSQFVRRMERRYECSSDFAVDAVRNGYMKETAEVSRWLTSYQALRRLQEASGQGIGTSTRTTR